MSRKILSAILAVCMVFTMCIGMVGVSAADGDVTISCGASGTAIQGKGGDIINIPISVSGNTKGISQFYIDLEYDDTYIAPLSNDSYTKTDSLFASAMWIGNALMPENTLTASGYPADAVMARVAVTNFTGNITGDGLIFTYQFKIKEDVSVPAETEVKIYIGKMGRQGTNGSISDVTVASIQQPDKIAVQVPTNISIPETTTVEYDGTAKPIEVTAPAGVSTTVTYNDSTDVPTEAGTYEVKASATGGYIANEATGTLVIEKRNLTVTAQNAMKKVGNNDPALEVSYDESVLLAADKVAGELVRETGETAGTYAITQKTGSEYKVVNKATGAVNNNYNVTFVAGQFVIADKTPQTITVGQSSFTKTYGDAPFAITASADAASGLDTFTYSVEKENAGDPDVVTVDAEGNVTIVGAGTAKVIVSQAGNDEYAPATAQVSVTVNRVNLTITAKNANKKIGSADPALEVTYDESLLRSQDKVVGELVRETGETAGTYAITQKTGSEYKVVYKEGGAENNNYNVTFVAGQFVIADKTPQTITVEQSSFTKTYGDASFAITASADAASGLDTFTYSVEKENAGDPDVVTVDAEGNVTIVGAGTAKVIVSQAGNDEYAPATAQVSITVNRVDLSITLTGKTIIYGGEIGDFEISYDGFIDGESEEDLLTAVTVAGLPEGKVNAGTYVLTIEGGESDNYNVSKKGANLIVNKREIEIASIGVFNKNEDGTTEAIINPTSIEFTDGKDILTGDDVVVSVTASAAFEDAEAGTDKAVTISGVSAEITGADKNNYVVHVADGALSTTATIFADGAMTAADVAAQIGSAMRVSGDSKTLDMPAVPEGFEIAIYSSSDEEIIALDGTVKAKGEASTVDVVFIVKNTNNETDTANTGTVKVSVPKGSFKMVTTVVYGRGTLAGDTGEQIVGSTITLTATPGSGYKVSEWFVNGVSVGGAGVSVKEFVLEDDVEIGVKFVSKSGGVVGGGAIGGSTTTQTVKAPDSSVKNGTTLYKGEVIKLSTITSGASVYYTTDGTEPTAETGTLYTDDGIRISGDVTIKAVAIKDSNPSAVSVFTYKVKTAKAEFKSDASSIKYMENVTADTFEPDRAATRYEVIKALDEIMDIEESKIENGFSDVTDEYKGLVNKFAATSIIDGYPDKTFGGGNGITRAEFVKMLAEALALDMSEEVTVTFADVLPGHWAEKYIAAFSKLGYILGDPDGSFRPDDNVTRAEVVTVVNRVLNIASSPEAEQKYTDLDTSHWGYGFIMSAEKDKA